MTMKGKREQVAVYLDPQQIERLRRLNKTTRVPTAEYIREGVDMVLAKYRKRKR
jgi:predicted DNA-binding protein